jgi:Ca-activated chloride channel family protein
VATLAAAVLAAGTRTGRAQFSTTTELVEVYASVTGSQGASVAGLRAEEFTVYENGVAQPIQAFAEGEFPLAAVLAIDRSFSMTGAPLRLARDAARTFLERLRAEDRALIVAVGSEVEALGELSTDRQQQRAALDSLVPWGTTSLHDAIVEVLGRLRQEGGRRAMLVLSDGQDRFSRATADQVRADVRGGDVLVYGITLAREPSPLLRELADLSGARAFHVTTPPQLPGVFEQIARELRTQYLLGYAPPPGPPGWRTIEVRVSRPGASVRARQGYLAR